MGVEPGADPGFLARGFICKEVGVRLADFIYFFLILKNGGQGWGSSEPIEPPLDLPVGSI